MYVKAKASLRLDHTFCSHPLFTPSVHTFCPHLMSTPSISHLLFAFTPPVHIHRRRCGWTLRSRAPASPSDRSDEVLGPSDDEVHARRSEGRPRAGSGQPDRHALHVLFCAGSSPLRSMPNPQPSSGERHVSRVVCVSRVCSVSSLRHTPKAAIPAAAG